MIVILEKNKNNKFEFTKKELEKLLKEARNEGCAEYYKAGCDKLAQKYITTPPYEPIHIPKDMGVGDYIVCK